jgi:polysaccharide lyase-like protein
VNATFCADFEEASGPPVNSPLGTATVVAYNGTFADLMTLDTQVFYAGHQSLKVSAGTESAFRTLGVAAPSSTFWVRMYVRSDDTFGDSTAVHDAWFQAASYPGANPTNGGSPSVQFAEQYCRVLLNANDSLFPMGLSQCSTSGPTLAPNQWHCVEALFDGVNGDVQIYADGNQIIDAQTWSPATQAFSAFDFGFIKYSGPDRTVWYDDVALGPTRIGCE